MITNVSFLATEFAKDIDNFTCPLFNKTVFNFSFYTQMKILRSPGRC